LAYLQVALGLIEQNKKDINFNIMGIPDQQKMIEESLHNITNILKEEGFEFYEVEIPKRPSIWQRFKKFIYAFCVPQGN
jgi:5,10-methenyltetrahydromethanopterin hydrogenase